MLTSSYEKLPECMKNEVVFSYYEMLYEKRVALFFKRFFDIILSLILIVILLPLIIVIAILIKLDSKGPIFYTQTRITKNLKEFHIVKFRTMYHNTNANDEMLTLASDNRITRVGTKLRKLRLDEIPQLFNILLGSMSFVGTRPEVVKYVKNYTPEMMATLLLVAGLTSKASILFRNESELLVSKSDIDRVYLKEILPTKMIHNLEYLRDYRFINDLKILFQTLFM